MSVCSYAVHRILIPKGEPLQMRLRFLISWTLNGGIIQDYLAEPCAIRRTIKSGRGIGWGSQREDSTRPCWLCRCNEGAVCRGEQAASGQWKGQWGQSSPWRCWGGTHPTNLWGWPCEVCVGALICRTWRWLTCTILSRDTFGDLISSLPFSHMCRFM